jgi:WD40 repeat protein/actin-like ATPase involved in cell morphogenesis
VSEHIIAIDFGTSTSAAILVTGGQEELIEEPSGHGRTWPTAVSVADGKLVIGTVAEQSKRRYPERYRTEFKPEFGRPHPVDLGGQAWTMTTLVTEFFAQMREAAERVAGAPVDRAVLTMPASYVSHDRRRDLMLAAAKTAGYELADLLPEPVAAALAPAAGAAIGTGSLLLIYDFGGGTFDTALVRVGARANQVLGSAAIESGCGGRDIDSAVAGYLAATGGPELAAALARSQREPLQLNSQAKELKHRLTETKTAEDYFGSTDIPISITRDKLNELTEPLLARTLECVDGLLSGCGVALDDVDVVLMVGGVTRMPIVEQTVQKRLGRPLRNARSPELAVVQGAARFAAATATRFSVPRPPRLPERPLRWDIPGESATMLDCLARAGEQFAAGQAIGRVRLDSGAIWELRAGTPGRVRTWHASPGAAVFSGDWLVTAEAMPPRLINPSEVLSVRHEADINAIAFSPDGKSFATAADDKTVRIGTLKGNRRSSSWHKLWMQSVTATIPIAELRPLEHDGSVLAIAYSPDGTRLATGSSSGTAQLWNVAQDTSVKQLACGTTVSGVAFSPDGRYLVTAGDCLYRWALATDTKTMLRAGAVRDVRYSPDGRIVVASCPAERRALVIDVTTGAVVTEADTGDGLGFVALSPDGAWFAAGRDGQSAAIRDTATGDLITVLAHPRASCAAFSPDGTLCLTGGTGSHVLVWDAATGDQLTQIPAEGGVRTVVFGPGGDLVGLAGRDRTAQIWRIR